MIELLCALAVDAKQAMQMIRARVGIRTDVLILSFAWWEGAAVITQSISWSARVIEDTADSCRRLYSQEVMQGIG